MYSLLLSCACTVFFCNPVAYWPLWEKKRIEVGEWKRREERGKRREETETETETERKEDRLRMSLE